MPYHSSLQHPPTRSCDVFFRWWWFQSALIVVRVRIVDSRPRTLLPKFGADSRCIQHPRGGLGDAFGTDARTDASAGWGEICTSRPMRELGNRIGSVLTFHSSVARVQSALRVCEASFSAPSLNSRLVKPEGTIAGWWRAIGSILRSSFSLDILHNNVAMSLAKGLFAKIPSRTCMYRTM